MEASARSRRLALPAAVGAAVVVSLLGLAGFAGVSWQRSVALVSDDVGHLGRLGSLPRFSVTTSADGEEEDSYSRGRDGDAGDVSGYEVGRGMLAAGGLQQQQQQQQSLACMDPNPPAGCGTGVMVVQPSAGMDVGEVRVSRMAPPPAPPPTIVRYGDVGVAPKGCPTCPVLDTKVVALQKQQMKANQERIDRLARLIQKNRESMEKTVDNMRILKTVMGSAVFDMKEAVRKLDVDIESKLAIQSKKGGPQGDKGAAGFDGIPGRDGAPGEPGLAGRPGSMGPPGYVGWRGLPGISGDRGGPGPVGKGGWEGPKGHQGERGGEGKVGPASDLLRCSRIGGQLYKGICWKSEMLTENKDNKPKACSIWNPKQNWGEDEWWELVKLFQSKKTSSHIDRENSEGGLCSNFIASISFTEGGDETKIWANKETFAKMDPSVSNKCKIYNGEDTRAIYACAT